MAVVINFVIDNYIWFMCGVILILLAIIGGYADKTNFGEGKKVVKIKKKKDDIIDSLNIAKGELSNDEVQTQNQEQEVINNNTSDMNAVTSEGPNAEKIFGDNELGTNNNTNNSQQSETNSNDVSKENLDSSAEEFKKEEEELEALLPEKDILDDDLFQDLDDIADINLDIKKEEFKDIPDLDDVSLPEIGKGRKKSKQIWKM